MKYSLIPAIGACALLAACSGVKWPTIPASAIVNALPPDVVAQSRQWCEVAKPLLPLASLAPSAEARIIGGFVAGYCEQLLAGAVPATTDLNTPAWLNTNVTALSALLGVIPRT